MFKQKITQPTWYFSCDICSNEPWVGLTTNCNSLPVLLCNSPWTILHILSPHLSKRVSPHYPDNKKINDLLYILCPKLTKLCLSEFMSSLPLSKFNLSLWAHFPSSTLNSRTSGNFFPLCSAIFSPLYCNTPVLYKFIIACWKLKK